MDISAKKLIQLLEPGRDPEVRAAAATILGELAGRDGPACKALCSSLEDEEPELRKAALVAVGKQRVESALPILVERIKLGGVEGEIAAMSAARLGPKGIKALTEMLHKVVPGLRRYIAGALAEVGSAHPDEHLTAILRDTDPAIVEKTASSLIGRIPTLRPAQRNALSEQLLEIANDKKARLSVATEEAVIRLLSALEEPRAAPALWDRLLPPRPTEVRVAALQAIGSFAGSPNKEQLKKLFQCAAENDFRIVAPALLTLSKLKVTDKVVPEWLTLLHAPDIAARQLALEKLGEHDSKEVAEAFLPLLKHVDRNLREAALAKLTRLEEGRLALSKNLLSAVSIEEMWPLVRSIMPFVKGFPAAWRAAVFTELCEFIEAHDRRADPLVALLKEASTAEMRDQLIEQATALRKKKDYTTALHYLKLLGRDPACGFPVRIELATCGLKESAKDLDLDARINDPCLHQFSQLAQQDAGELSALVEKVKWLEPEDLYYLGFHFSEQSGKLKKFGIGVLQLVQKRAGRTKLGQAAKAKLKTVGDEPE